MGFIGKYQTFELLGSGSISSVYRAIDRLLDREVALKILNSNVDPALAERFHREARIGIGLQHPNIARIFDLNEADGVTHIAMELLQGGNLKRYIEQKSPLPLTQKIELIAQVCDGLAAAHAKGIVHRDIRPATIFVHENRTAKLLDFGLARLPDSMPALAARAWGTPDYMAPEQVVSLRGSPRSDLFSVALVLYEFLVYAHPFRGDSIPQRIADDEPDDPRELDASIPDSLAIVLREALRKRPAERIATAEDFAAALRDVLRNLRAAASISENDSHGAAGDRPAVQSESRQNEDLDAESIAELVRSLGVWDSPPQENPDSSRTLLVRTHELTEVNERFARAAAEPDSPMGDVAALQVLTPAGVDAEPDLADAVALLRKELGDDCTPVTPASAPQGAPAFEAWNDAHSPYPESYRGMQPPSVEVPEPWTKRTKDALRRFFRIFAEGCRTYGKQIKSRDLGSMPPNAWRRLIALGIRLKPFGSRLAQRGRGLRARLSQRFERRAAITAAIASFLLVLAAGLVFVGRTAKKPTPVEKAVANAAVDVATADFHETGNGTSKVLFTLARGTRVNLLESRPASGSGLIRAQLVSERGNSRPGYLRVRDLGEWTSDDPSVEWDLVGLNRPGGDAGDAQRRAFSDELELFAARFPGTAQEAQARLQELTILVDLASQAQKAGKPRFEWQRDLDRANGLLSTGDGSPANAAKFEDLRKRLEQLSAPRKKPRPPRDPQIAVRQQRLGELNQRAKALYAQGDIDGALAEADRMLSIDPKNQQALRWKSQVEDVRKILSSR